MLRNLNRMYHSFRSEHSDQLHYIDIGKGQPIVFLHGFGMEAAQWLPFAAPLARKHRIIIPDLRGFGRSHKARYSSPCVISDFAKDLDRLVTKLNIRRFKLVGISMGALTALKYIEEYGEHKVQRYFHIDQSPKCLNSEDWPWGLYGDQQAERLGRAKALLSELEPYAQKDTAYEDLPKNVKQKLWKEFGQFFASALSRPSHKNIAKTLCGYPLSFQQLVKTDNWSAYMDCFRAYIEQGYDLRQALTQSQVPINLVVGMKSEMYPPAGQLRIADYANNVKVLPYTNSGHTPLIDQPLKLFSDIKRFAAA